MDASGSTVSAMRKLMSAVCVAVVNSGGREMDVKKCNRNVSLSVE